MTEIIVGLLGYPHTLIKNQNIRLLNVIYRPIFKFN